MSTLTAKRSLIAHLDPGSQVADNYRSLRNVIDQSPLLDRRKVIAVTSAMPGEGKTTTVVNLAVAIAQSGRSVLLVDGNLSQPALHDVFSENNHFGLSNVLAGSASLKEAVKEVGIPNLSLLTSGALLPQSADLLGSKQADHFLNEAAAAYEYVLLDAPSLLIQSDATSLAVRSHAVVWVVHAKRSTRAQAGEAKRIIEQMNIQVVGCVLNHVQAGRRRRVR